MLSFFTRKKYLVDQLNDFVDIHNHILPGIDDGAKNTQESLAIIEGFSEFGVKNFVCTPHIMHNYHDNTPKTIKASYKKLKAALKDAKINDIALDYAAEHMIDDKFEDLLKENKILPIRQYYLLVEMSFLQSPINFDTAIEKVVAANYFPILAHPERYTFLHANFGKYHSYKQKNIMFQANLLSLAGYYGNDVKSITLKLLEKGLIDFLASDVHNAKQLDYIKECTLSSTMVTKINHLVNHTIETFW